MIRFEYPLQWKVHIPRTIRRINARFSTHSTSYAGDMLIDELKRLGAKDCVVSTNLELRQRGDGFYANQRVDDPGVAVFFNLKGSQKVMCVDLYEKVEHNLWALYLTVKAIRGIDRWGGAQIMDGIFTGFAALPSPEQVSSSNVPQYFADCVSKEHARERFVTLAKKLHPDQGGNALEFAEMKRQYDMVK